MGVKVVTLAEKPIAQSSEYIATLRSMRSTTIMPLADGLVTRIFVVSGARVKPGQPILQLEADKEQAALRSLEARRAALVAEVAFSRQQAERATALVSQGAVSKQEAEEAQTRLETAEAQIEGARRADPRAARPGWILPGHGARGWRRSATSPCASANASRPRRRSRRSINRPGRRIAGRGSDLEAHIAVPLERATDLRLGLPVQFLDAAGTVVATKRDYLRGAARRRGHADGARQEPAASRRRRDARPAVRPRAASCGDGAGTGGPRRRGQRGSAVQHFAFVAEAAQGRHRGPPATRQVGEIVGRRIHRPRRHQSRASGDHVSGIQKIGDGAPVTQSPSCAASR